MMGDITFVLHVLAAIFATWRLTEIVTMDRISEPVRRRWPHYLWGCPRCVSVWAGMTVTGLLIFVPWLNWPLALSWLFLVKLDVMHLRRFRGNVVRAISGGSGGLDRLHPAHPRPGGPLRGALSTLANMAGNPPEAGTTYTLLGNGTALQNGVEFAAALANPALTCGDTIVLPAGVSFQNAQSQSFVPPVKSCASNPITIRSSAAASLPTTKTTCSDSGVAFSTILCPSRDTSLFATLVGDETPVIQFPCGTKGWTFIGLKITDAAIVRGNVTFTTSHVDFNPGGCSAYDMATTTTHLVFDRTWMKPGLVAVDGGNNEVSAAIGFNFASGNVTVRRSYIEGFAGYQPGTTQRTNSYGILFGPGGPALFEDNFIAAFFNNIFLTGGQPNPSHTATVTSPTLTSATFSAVTDLAIGDYLALQVPGGSALSVTDAATSGAGSTTVTSTTGGFTSGMIGMTFYPTGGTNFVGGGRRITAVASSNSLTVATSPTPSGAGSGGIATIANCPAATGIPCYQSAVVTGIAGSVISYDPVGPDQCFSSTQYISQCKLTVAPLSGGISTWRGLLPHDITVNRNVMFKPLWWQSGIFSGGAKNYVEIKQCDTCLFTGNRIQGACSNFVTPETAGSATNNAAPWVTIKNLTVRSNLIQGNGYLGWIATNDESTNITPQDLLYENNLLTAMPLYCPPLGSPGEHLVDNGAVFVGGASLRVSWKHNTLRGATTDGNLLAVLQSGAVFGQPASTDAVWRDNLHDYFWYGLSVQYTRDAAFPNFTEDHNVLNTRFDIQPGRDPCGNVDNPGQQTKQFPNSCATTPTGLAANDAAVKFANAAACDDGSDYHGCGLASDSVYKGKASDATDPGVNLTLLDAALSG